MLKRRIRSWVLTGSPEGAQHLIGEAGGVLDPLQRTVPAEVAVDGGEHAHREDAVAPRGGGLRTVTQTSSAGGSAETGHMALTVCP